MTTDITRARGENPMTAEELHHLTAPLWMVAVETRPTRLHYNPAEDGFWTIISGTPGKDLDCNGIDTEDAASLCEVEVMKALRKTRALRLFPNDPGESAMVHVRVMDHENIPGDSEYSRRHGWAVFYGPTQLHALVAAAIAVLSAGRGEG